MTRPSWQGREHAGERRNGGYRVFRDGTPVGQTQDLSMTLEHLAHETGYMFTVVALDSLGAISAPSAPLEIMTVDPTLRPPRRVG